MEKDRGIAGSADRPRGHLRLVHSRRGMSAVPRISARAKTWGQPRPARPLEAGEGAFDPSIFSQALGDLIIAAGGRVPERVVLAAAGKPLDTARFTSELAVHARHIGLAVLAAELNCSTGRTNLRWFDAPGVDSASPDPLALDLFNPRWPEDFTAWRGRTARFADMVLIAGPSLDRSIDAALVASEFDGIVLLASRTSTPRQAIEDAARRCRGLGARLFGVAMVDGIGQAFERIPRPESSHSPDLVEAPTSTGHRPV